MLLSRTGAATRAGVHLDEMRRAGAQVEIRNADVADVSALERVLAEIAQSPHPLRGIVHAAGVLDDATLPRVTPAQLVGVMRPKVNGAWNLHCLTEHLQLDAFVLFSSVASLLGPAGQTSHAAANAFLDGLATFRRARGLPGLSIQWSVWADIGAAARAGADRAAADFGLGRITPEVGIQALEQLWYDVRPVVAVIPADWAAFKRRSGASPLLANLHSPRPRAPLPERRILDELSAMPLSRRRDELRAYLRERVAIVLGLDNGSALVDSLGFFEIGMDSLTSVELRNELQRQFDVKMPTTLTFDYPTVADLAEYLAREVIALDFGALQAAASCSAGILSHLTDAEVEAELDAELEQSASGRAT